MQPKYKVLALTTLSKK